MFAIKQNWSLAPLFREAAQRGLTSVVANKKDAQSARQKPTRCSPAQKLQANKCPLKICNFVWYVYFLSTKFMCYVHFGSMDFRKVSTNLASPTVGGHQKQAQKNRWPAETRAFAKQENKMQPKWKTKVRQMGKSNRAKWENKSAPKRKIIDSQMRKCYA